MSGFLVQHYLAARAAADSSAPALSDGRRRLSYGELAAAAHRLAHGLRAAGVPPRGRVALCMERSVDPVVAMLGAMGAGAAYVPLDPGAPRARWTVMLDDCRPDALVCDRERLAPLREVLDELGLELPIFVTAPEGAPTEDPGEGVTPTTALSSLPAEAPDAGVGEDDLAYILYTSGSTGRPKGVTITHGNVRAYIDWAVAEFSVTPADVVLSTAPFHFDMSVFDLFVPLAAGARLAVADRSLALFPSRLVEFAEREEATIWKGVSSLLMYMERARVLAPGRLPALRWVLFGGETLPTRTLMRWMEIYPDKAYCNAFGPTEATGISVYHVMRAPPASADARVPIGRPCAGTEASVRDGDGREVADGEVGELYLGGPCLSPGYLGDPEGTARAFLTEPAGPGGAPRRLYRTGDIVQRNDRGELEFIGRRDGQVKSMGYRIELGDIEHALRAVDGVADAAVILVEDGPAGLRELVGFFEGSPTVDEGETQRELARRLPSYMAPRRLMRLDRLPRGDRGKVDRAALAERV